MIELKISNEKNLNLGRLVCTGGYIKLDYIKSISIRIFCCACISQDKYIEMIYDKRKNCETQVNLKILNNNISLKFFQIFFFSLLKIIILNLI